jgi:guanine deaminase
MHDTFLARAIELAVENVKIGGGPFGAVIVRGDEIIAACANQVAPMNDPTAHAEIVAIREACRKLSAFQLQGCEIYSSCEPCPMCLGAIYWAHLDRLYFAATREQAAAAGFDDLLLYQQIALPLEQRSLPSQRIEWSDAEKPFQLWNTKPDRTKY